MNKKLILFIVPLVLSLTSCQQETKKNFVTGPDLTLTSIEMMERYGEATLIQYGSYDILVDSGTSRDANHIKEVLNTKVVDKTIDMFVVTHPHGDHIGGVINGCLDSFKISTIVDYGYTYVTNENGAIENSAYVSNYTNWRDAQISGGTTYYAITDALKEIPTVTVNKEEECYIKWLKNDYYVAKGKAFPNSDIPSDNPNTTSVSFYLQYKNWNILMCGDADSTFTEMSIMNNYPKLFQSKEERVLLKATHHGSNSSMGAAFLDWCQPDIIYVSAAMVDGVCIPNQVTFGTDNSQQSHPDRSTVKRMANRLEQVYWNGINGDLIMSVDGVNDPTVIGLGRSKNYYQTDGGPASITAEKNVTLFESEFYKYFTKK